MRLAMATRAHCTACMLMVVIWVQAADDGHTPAHKAALNGHGGSLRLLHEWGCNMEQADVQRDRDVVYVIRVYTRISAPKTP